MRAYFPRPPDLASLEMLRRAVGDSCTIQSEARPDDFEVLIEGRPDAATLDVPSLRAVIIPYAGVPVGTLELVRARSDLALYNLHHNAADTAEVTLALLMAAGKQVVPMDQALRKDDWTLSYLPSTAFSFAGKTALVLGFGEIGQRIAAMLIGLGMEVLATRRRAADPYVENGVHVFPDARLHDLLPRAQVLVVALPMTEETTGLLGERELGLLPNGAVLANAARGPIIDEEPLYDALKSRHLHSAGLDVWYSYPKADDASVVIPGMESVPKSASQTPPSKFPFGELDNVVMSPHRGGTSQDTETRRAEALASILRDLVEGKEPQNRVDLDRGY